jgi:hypothetical protein
MLNLDPWRLYPLQLQFLSSSFSPFRSGCPDLPSHMNIVVAPMEVQHCAHALRLPHLLNAPDDDDDDYNDNDFASKMIIAPLTQS